MTIRVSREDLDRAIGEMSLDPDTVDGLWRRLELSAASRPRFDGAHVLYYGGALVVILGMVFLAATQWDSLDGIEIVALAGVYGAVFLAAGHWIWSRFEHSRTAGGLFVVMAVSMTPVIVYGLQRQYDLWPFGAPGEYRDFHVWIRGGWFVMEVTTIAAAALALVFYRFAFLTAPLAFMLWYLSMDLTPILFDSQTAGWDERLSVSVVFGLAVILLAYAVDLGTRRDFAFWLYLSGLLAFCGGLGMMESKSELSRFAYFLINLGLVGLSVYLRRRVFAVFGALGVIGYVGYLSYKLFPDQILFTVALAVIGVAVLGLGVLLARNQPAINAWIERTIPEPLKRLRPE